jgi:hypothetical protein
MRDTNDDKKIALQHFLRRTKDENIKNRIKKVFDENPLRGATQIVTSEFGFQCPKGWKRCPDGSCVPKGEVCE